MNSDIQDTSVRADIVVDVSAEEAFRLFTERFDQIKPREHNLLRADIAESVFEPRAGGRIYDRGVDGSECQWGQVLAYVPPARILFTWGISPRWQLEADPARSSEVEIRFVPEAGLRTRVVIEHRHLDRHGQGWEGLADAVRGNHGWPLYLQRFRDASSKDGR